MKLHHWAATLALVVSGCRVTAHTATVQFVVVTPAGTMRSYRVHEFFNEDQKHAFDGLFHGKSSATGVPYGRYTYTLVRDDLKNPTWSTLQGKVEVRDRDVIVTLTDRNEVVVVDGKEALVEEVTVPRKLRGVVSGRERLGGTVWVRLINVFTSQRLDRVLDKKGEFSAEIEPGSWLLLLLRDSSVLQTEAFVLEPGEGEMSIRRSEAGRRTIQLTVAIQ